MRFLRIPSHAGSRVLRASYAGINFEHPVIFWSPHCAWLNSGPPNLLGKFSIHRGKERRRELRIETNYTSACILSSRRQEGKLKVLMQSISNFNSRSGSYKQCSPCIHVLFSGEVSGARGGSRTRTPRRARDFKSPAYAIPPPGHRASKSILQKSTPQHGSCQTLETFAKSHRNQ